MKKRLPAETPAKWDALLPTSLVRAFGGKLVPQDFTDAPGQEWLERIRAESESFGMSL